ncbi:complement C1q tumor necrosis factor-related protein 3-like [Saccostrea echinata]|uniref:complement C1q tumor necrosis factor-related protein 3-like n=1 Tax=Saccostrea echinata TaxID=191078 RepID=UPI002A80F153|nr:complement C1q tumor necrosis factor-related protein 3-like [Saccostrea echinata]
MTWCHCPCKKDIEYYNICMKSSQNSNNACGLHLTEYDTCIKKKFTELESKVEMFGHSQNRTTHHISFMASLSRNLNLVRGTLLIFDSVITNKGGAYSSSTGIFTAPVTGSYFFVVTLGLPTPSSSEGGDYIRILFLKNGKRSGYLFIGTEGLWTRRSENSLMELSKGDKVKLSIITTGTGFSYIAGGNYHSHFSGFLIN